MAELSEKFKEVILHKNYLFHLHTNYTDGHCAVNDYCQWAVEHGVDALIFTEHVRKKPSYDFNRFLADIEQARISYPNLDIWAGVEAKVLPGGGLDLGIDAAPKVPVICFACHSFPRDIRLYQRSLEILFSSPEWMNHIRVWVHPGRFLKKEGLLNKSRSLLQKLVMTAANEGVIIELNLKENLLPETLTAAIPTQQRDS
jgi:putative hydrolase